MDAELSPALALELFEKSGRGKSYALSELLTIFSAGHKRKRELEAILASLVADGKLVRLKGPAFTLPQGLKNLRGHIKIQRQGMGFVRPDGGGEEIYIHPSQINGAWDGDFVLVGILPGKSGKSREGRVLEVLERRVRELLVELLPQAVQEEGITKRLARPLDSRLAGYLLVDLEGLEKRPHQGDLVLAEPLSKAYGDGVIRAKAVSSFGAGESLSMFERLVKAEHNIATEFPAPALRETATLPPDPDPVEVLASEVDSPIRHDLRHLGLVTIDGSDARDFDDAICVERSKDGYTLWVAIADVAAYVAPGSELDREALKRGNSCYFPASVEPMLPQELSNGLCSLKPGVPRLAVVAELSMSLRGAPQKAEFYRALIQSRSRLTYEGAQKMLGDSSDASPVAAMLREAQKLAEALLKRREERGTLSFDLPEARAEVDAKGKITALALRERLFTHRLIEEFMIAANEAVAVRLAGYAEQGLSFLYRAHPAPDADKLADLAKVLAQAGPQFDLGAALPERPGAGDLQRLLEAVQGTPREFVVNRLVLRSLMQAVYSPVPEGHFGLASEAYAHFTSPIRRYADLTVHRALLHTLGYAGKIPSHGMLAQIAEDLNDREREAVAAEREILKICAALYLRDYIGEQFEAAVSGVSAFGLFVELAEPPCEGFVRLESLPDDYYQLDHERHLLLGQRSGARFSLGQPLLLRLVKADPLRQEITFELVDAGKNRKGNGGSSGKRKPETRGKSRQTRGKKKRQALPKGSVRRRAS